MKRLSFALLFVLLTNAFAQQPTALQGGWYWSDNKDPITDSDSSLVAKQAYDAPQYDENSALILRCNSSEPMGFDIYFVLDDYVGSDPTYTVTSRFDKEAPTSAAWFTSTDGSALFVPSSQAQRFLASVTTHANLALRLYDYDGTPMTYQVNLSGTRDAASHLACLSRLTR